MPVLASGGRWERLRGGTRVDHARREPRGQPHPGRGRGGRGPVERRIVPAARTRPGADRRAGDPRRDAACPRAPRRPGDRDGCAACVLGAARRLMTEFVRVGSLAEIPEGELRAYDIPSGRVVVTHDERRLFAVSETCTGNGCALADGTFDDRSDRLVCAACESVFDAETGEPLEGPARDPLAVFTAREVDGWVEISAEPVG
ncbi:MAG: Rieske 2Fe-2S domain-containing protein [Actinobacteria bacterium]|nr:MAG: Rieske 2Fe-2S domain-containing protein [Actinomycetota bacterium]